MGGAGSISGQGAKTLEGIVVKKEKHKKIVFFKYNYFYQKLVSASNFIYSLVYYNHIRGLGKHSLPF